MLYEKLDYVLAIAEEQNLTRAAKKLYISQPTLTMYLNRLEENLGVKLFDRKKNPITITPAGRRYIEKMTEISEEEQILRGELKSVQNPAQTFRIGSSRVRGHYYLPPLLRILSKQHPDMNFVISLGTGRHPARLRPDGPLHGGYLQRPDPACGHGHRPQCYSSGQHRHLAVLAHWLVHRHGPVPGVLRHGHPQGPGRAGGSGRGPGPGGRAGGSGRVCSPG